MNNDDLKEFANILFAPSERDEYKRRIDKAIEYIEKTRNTLLLSYPPKEAFDIDKLLDILKGSDKE